MPTEPITIPDDLLGLKPSTDLESVSLSSLASKGTSVLQEILATAQGVAITVEGQGAMVTVSRDQYDEMVALIQQLQAEPADDGFTQALSQQFDALVEEMNQPGAAQATQAVLFAGPESLNETYRPSDTEIDTEIDTRTDHRPKSDE